MDVDQYDDDKYMDDTEVDSDLPDAQGANDAEVNNFLAQYPSFRVQSIDYCCVTFLIYAHNLIIFVCMECNFFIYSCKMIG